MTKELIIAVYDKDYSWINHVNQDVIKTIYRKGHAQQLAPNEIRIEPHKGRDVHTFFWHIYNKYESLSDITYFAQDFPFDHWGNIIDKLNGNDFDDCTMKIGEYYGYYNPVVDTGLRLIDGKQFTGGKVLPCLSNGMPHDATNNVNVNKFWDILIDEPKVPVYEFLPAGHFAIHKNQILKRTKKFYGEIVSLLENHDEAPWSIERLELYIFDERFKAKY